MKPKNKTAKSHIKSRINTVKSIDNNSPNTGPTNTDPEVKERRTNNRRYTAAYKLRILERADACKSERGEIGRLLRSEGLYSTMLSEWRKARSNGMLTGLSPKKRGAKPKEINPLASRVTALERSKLELEKRLEISQKIIEAQKKLPRSLPR